MNKLIIAALIASAFSLSAQAQQTTNGANAAQTATGTGQASIASGAVSVQSYGAPQLPWTAATASTSADFHTNQAMSAPAVYGTAAPSAGGCGAVDGWSAGVVVANGGKSSAVELPGCMLNLLADRMESLSVVKVVGIDGKERTEWTGKSLMKLEGWCLYPLYRTAIENSGTFKCKATRDAEAEAARTKRVSAVPTEQQLVAARPVALLP